LVTPTRPSNPFLKSAIKWMYLSSSMNELSCRD
jgi:hypothetical protein